MKKVYKVTRKGKENFTSAVAKNKWKLKYHLDSTTIPQVGMIYCFRNRSDAERWVRGITPDVDFDKGTYCILECEPVGRVGNRVIATYYRRITAAFWDTYRRAVLSKKSLNDIDLEGTPPGSILCEGVIPRKVIYSRKVY